MPTTKPERMEFLKKAYEWEQDRLQSWANDVRASTGGVANPMIEFFGQAWLIYLEKVQESNQAILGRLTGALRSGAAGVDEATRHLNRVEHRKGTISSISDAANDHRHDSEYFKSLDAVIDLENEVRDHIEHYLNYGP
jgi:hypothetical protein